MDRRKFVRPSMGGVIVDMSGLFSVFEQQQLGRTGRILLVKGGGIIVNAPNVTPDLRLMSEEFTAVRDALGTLEGRQSGHVDGRGEPMERVLSATQIRG